MVRFNPIRASEKTIREIVESETGVLIGKELNQVEVYPLERAEDIQPVLMNLNASGFRTSIGTRIK